MKRQTNFFLVLLSVLMLFSSSTYSQLLTVKNLTGFSDLLLQPHHQNPAPFDKIVFDNLPKGYIVTELITKLSVKPPHFRSYRFTVSNIKNTDNEKFTFLVEENTGGYRKLISLLFSTQNFETYKKWYEDLNSSSEITKNSPLINALLYQYKRKAITLAINYTSKADTRDLTIDTVSATNPITYYMTIQYPDITPPIAPTKEYLSHLKGKK